MIRNQWYAILEANEVKAGRPVGVTRMGEKLVVWRDGRGQVTVMHDLCPHRGAALSIGKLEGDCIECPFHGFLFDTSGRCTLIPANGKTVPVRKAFRVQAYPTQEAHGLIYIWWGEPQESYPDLPWFDNVPEGSFSYITIRDHWPVHYTRAIENQLDVLHVPFVHRTTIGRGVGPVTDGPFLEWLDQDRFRIYMRNRYDDGTPALKPEEMTRPASNFYLEFAFANVWQNHLTDRMRILVIFAPIDEGNTALYVRLYQKFVTTPVLRTAFNGLMWLPNYYIVLQDKRVVITERPVKTDLRMGEKLVPGDGPIIAYRRRRQELIDLAGQED